jgi:hypothetical protein
MGRKAADPKYKLPIWDGRAAEVVKLKAEAHALIIRW